MRAILSGFVVASLLLSGAALAADETLGEQTYRRVETRANDFTFSEQGAATLTTAADGSLIVVWNSRRQEEGTYGIYARRLSPSGVALGPELHVNQTTWNMQQRPAVTQDSEGNFIFAWESFEQDGDRGGIYARTFDSDLSAVGTAITEFQVHQNSEGHQTQVVIAASGDRIMTVWTGPGNDIQRQAAYGRVFKTSGEALSGEFRLDEPGEGSDQLPAVSAAKDGFVVVWARTDSDGKPASVLARLYDQDGKARGAARVVSTPSTFGPIEPVVATDVHGGFTVAWLEYGTDGSDYGVLARRYSSDGNALGAPFVVNDSTEGPQNGVAVATSFDGRTLFAWNGRDADGSGVYAKLYDSSGVALGNEFRVNRYESGDQSLSPATGVARAAFGPNGQMSVVWNGDAGLGDSSGAHVTSLIPVPDAHRGDVNLDGEINEADARAFFGIMKRADLDAARTVAADLNSDGHVDPADVPFLLELLPRDIVMERTLQAEVMGMDETVQSSLAALEAALDGSSYRSLSTSANGAPAVPHEPPSFDASRRVLDPYGGETNPFPIFGGFIGIVNTGWTPPDPHLAVGPTHVVGMTNGAIAFFQKNGTKDFQDEIEDSYGFWGSVGATGFVFDPEVVWDPHSQRFFAMAAEGYAPGNSSYALLAVSDDSNPNGTWHKYRINTTSQAGDLLDSPNIAVDADAVYITGDMWQSGSSYLIIIIDKNDVLFGGPNPPVTDISIYNGTQSHGIPVIVGSSPAMYLIEHFESTSNNSVRLHAITDPLGTPARVTYNLSVPSYGRPEDPPQMGTSTRPETFDARFWSCAYRNGYLWATHHINSGRVLARWYQIDMNGWPTSGSNPTLVQSGNVDPGGDVRTYFCSITADADDNAAVLFARSSPSEYISMSAAVRKNWDTLGTTRSPVILKDSTAGYSTSRWGDYAEIEVDPSDDRTFWALHEYTPGGGSWNTWVAYITDDLIATITPVSTTVQRGKRLRFDIEIENVSGSNQSFQYWLEAFRPGGVPYAGNPIGISAVNLLPGASVIRSYSPRVPANAPINLGYEMLLQVGGIYPTLNSQDGFDFEVIGPGPGSDRGAQPTRAVRSQSR